jgi:hypothetical protein
LFTVASDQPALRERGALALTDDEMVEDLHIDHGQAVLYALGDAEVR